MGSRATVERRQRPHATLLVAASSLAMLLVTVPALAAQAPSGVTGGPVPAGQDEPAQGLPGEAPVEPPVGTPGVCEHAAGEFLVGYVSEEALQAAPSENVVETFDGILAQHLVFDDIKNIPDPTSQRAAEEARKQELEARPGVAYAEYNCVAQVNQAAAEDAPSSIPSIASCSDCGRSVVESARKIIADGFDGGKDAYNVALEAARSAGPDDVAFASEPDEEAVPDGEYAEDAGSGDAGSADSDDAGSGAGDAAAEPEEDGSGAGEEDADSGSEAEEDAASGDVEAEPEGEDTRSTAEPVNGRNTAASEPGEAGGSRVLALGTGTLLLAAGVFVGRRLFRG